MWGRLQPVEPARALKLIDCDYGKTVLICTPDPVVDTRGDRIYRMRDGSITGDGQEKALETAH